MIPVKNTYYMLSYAFRTLTQGEPRNLGSENFENIHSLFAAILVNGLEIEIKRGLYKEYVPHQQSLGTVRGRINLHGTLLNRANQRRNIECEFDELTENNLVNQIIKSTLKLLMRHGKVRNETKKRASNILVFLDAVQEIELRYIRWEALATKRLNRANHMLLEVCKLVAQGLLLSEENGKEKLADFIHDQQMSALFEAFVREYYRYHYPELAPQATRLNWQVNHDTSYGTEHLPGMLTDITLTDSMRVHIIDTKFYKKNLITFNDRQILHSANLYQIFAYVKNKQLEIGNNKQVNGLLLYAKTDAETQPDANYEMSGNIISVRTLDLMQDFAGIETQLQAILEEFFPAT